MEKWLTEDQVAFVESEKYIKNVPFENFFSSSEKTHHTRRLYFSFLFCWFVFFLGIKCALNCDISMKKKMLENIRFKLRKINIFNLF